MEQLGKFKKQNETFDARLKELKRNSLSDQSEIKELRAKLRVSEHERSQLASKQGDAGEAKKALETLEAKRRSENQEKDRRIGELESVLAAEQTHNDSLKTRLGEAQGRANVELLEARSAKQAFEVELQQARIESERAKSSLTTLRSKAYDHEGELLQQLEDHRRMLSRVAQEYGRLASSTVPKAVHDRLKREATALQLQVNRLERKFVNAEGQIVELAQLIRHTMEQNDFLSIQLRETEEELSLHVDGLTSVLEERDSDPQGDDKLERVSRDIAREFYDTELLLRISLEDDRVVWSDFNRLRFEQLLLHSTFLLKHADAARHDAETHLKQAIAAEKQQAELVRQLSGARAEQDKLQLSLTDESCALEKARAEQESLKWKHEGEIQKARSERVALEQSARREKDARDKLAVALQQSKAAEEALSAEIDQ